MKAVKKLAGQSVVYGLSSIIGRFLNYLLVPLHTNIFSQPGQYGVVTEIYAYISFFIILYTYGMETAFFRFSQNQENDGKKVFSTIMSALIASTSVFTFILIYFSSDISSIIRYDGHSEYIIIMALVIAFDALSSMPFAKLRQESRAKRFALIKVLNISVNILLNLFFFLVLPYWATHSNLPMHDTVSKIYWPQNLVIYVFIANLIASITTLLFLLPEFRFSFRHFSTPLLRQILIYSLPLLIAGFAGMINETLDRVMIKFLIPDPVIAMNELGIYGACYKLSILMTLFVQAYRYAAEPFFFSMYGKDDAAKTYSVVMKYFVLTCSLIFLLVMLYIDIFKYFIGPSYRSGLHIVPVLLLANMFLGIFFNLSIWYKLTGKTIYGAYLAIAGAVITLVGNYYLIPVFGYSGAAWTTLGCYGAMMILSYILGQTKFPIHYQPAKLLAFILISVGMYLLSVFLDQTFSFGFATRMLINTMILLTFVALVYKFDHLKEIRIENES